MDAGHASSLLDGALQKLREQEKSWAELEHYHRGTHERPFAPRGVNREYDELREMAVAPWLRLVVKTPVQRLRVDGIRQNTSADADQATWDDVWKANQLDSRQRVVYTDAVVHGRGILSVWPNVDDPTRPIVRPESPRAVYMHPKPDDPFSPEWSIKAWSSLGVADVGAPNQVDRAVIYDDASFHRFERVKSKWTLALSGVNPLGANPFVEFSPGVDAEGRPQSMIRPLIPMQRAIDTARFDLLLAMQFSAYRQRVVVGYDPVVKDKDGNIVYKRDENGEYVKDGNGNLVPMLAQIGSPGVDRILSFPGADTKVFDLAESNLANYVDVISSLVQHLAAISQVPPQYLLGGMANLSGEALAAAESTLAALVADLQLSFQASYEQVMRLAHRAAGSDAAEAPTEVIWGDGQARAFSQTVDGIQKLISVGFPREAAFEMLPSATLEKVRRWMQMIEEEAENPYLSELAVKNASNSGDQLPDGSDEGESSGTDRAA